jgi:hypothetical protein
VICGEDTTEADDSALDVALVEDGGSPWLAPEPGEFALGLRHDPAPWVSSTGDGQERGVKGSDAHADESEAHSVGVLLLAAVPVAVARRAVMARDAENLVALGRDGTFRPVLAESWEVVDARTWKLPDTGDPVRSAPNFRQDSAETVIQDPHAGLGVSDRAAPLVLEP